ncbi:unnamed protein product [Cylicostephanus goldi]|uniref:MADF domain-containing protein n=1 Tax=Cylicostephanus goldi TaxID=71465 RepID=A0A3P6SFS2_CYLGO|nr:unnamed protein product [Cylicostephanus goldi]
MSPPIVDHQDVIVEEVLKRRNLLWDKSGNREPNLNQKRTQAWKEIRRIVFEKCDKEMSIESIKRCWRTRRGNVRDLLMKEKKYRNATGGGVSVALEQALTKGMANMTEADAKIARALGPEACFGGLRVAESAVCAPPPSECSVGFSESQESKELLKQLSTFESDSDSDAFDETPRKRCRRSNAQQQLFEEQTKYIRAKRMYLEKKYAILTKVDALVDRIQININVNVQPSGGPPPTQRTKVDNNIEESLLS